MILMLLCVACGTWCLLYLYTAITCKRCQSRVCMIGKTALVTGANSGMGLELCFQLATRGCTVIMADKNDCSDNMRRIREQTHNNNIQHEHLDLSSFASVRQFAEKLQSEHNSLDILVNNAGIITASPVISGDGHDTMIQVNYLGPFLLSHLLLNLLRPNRGRIIFVSSHAAFYGSIGMDTKCLNTTKQAESLLPVIRWWKQHWYAIFAYSRSKLCVATAAKMMGRKLRGTGITVNALHPGVVRTPLFKSVGPLSAASWIFSVLTTMHWMLAKSIVDGVQTALHLAISDEVENVTGQFFVECKLSLVDPTIFCSKRMHEEIWKVSEQVVNLSTNESIETLLTRSEINS